MPEQNLDAERKRYENGMTTNFQVLEAQRDVSNSRSREIAALVAYNKAVANFHRAVGDLLEVHNIQTDADPETFQTPTDRFENVRWLNYKKD